MQPGLFLCFSSLSTSQSAKMLIMSNVDKALPETSLPSSDAEFIDFRHQWTEGEPGREEDVSADIVCKEIDALLQSDGTDRNSFSNARFNQALELVESLEVDDRLRLIARLWESLPDMHRTSLGALLVRGLQPPLKLSIRRPAAKVYSAPRRFDLATIFAVTTAYSLLFAAMKGLSFPPIVSSMVAGFITLIGCAQALLFRGSRPRMASVFAGSTIYTAGIICECFLDPGFRPGDWLIGMLIYGVVFGGVLGYVGGVVVGGVFLIADVLRKRYSRNDRETEETLTDSNYAVQE
jgi:hypothetical protein